jgi:hypothetical protein
MQRILSLFLCLIAFAGCDKGLSPPPNDRPAIGGKVRFIGEWPHKDSVGQLALALVSTPPPYTDTGLLGGLYKTVLPVISSFGHGTKDTTFFYEVEPKPYYYLGVAQIILGEDTNIVRVIGFSHDENDAPRVFDLTNGGQILDVDIEVRFDSLPKQPFIE